MDEQEFRRVLNLFPVVRPRDYHAELDSLRQSTSCSASNKALKDWQDAWNDGERKEMENQEIDLHAEADKFCKAFQHVHKKLVLEGLSFDAAQKFLNS
ncbi:hypothetical protein QQP08_026495 [Theobroma cacao]|nr:hypothetical protein QQP08_024481 [Theobroma cacao]WRX34008.1 hypothetical protein QQP08_026495 [Theobroma cacao]